MNFNDHEFSFLGSLSPTYGVPVSPFPFDLESIDPANFTSLTPVVLTPYSTPPRSFGIDLINNTAEPHLYNLQPFTGDYKSAFLRELVVLQDDLPLYPNVTLYDLNDVSSFDSPYSSRSGDSAFSFPDQETMELELSMMDSDTSNSNSSSTSYSFFEDSLVESQANVSGGCGPVPVTVKMEEDNEPHRVQEIKVEPRDDEEVDTIFPTSMFSPCGNGGGLSNQAPVRGTVKKSKPNHANKLSTYQTAKDKKIFPFRLHDLASDENFEPLTWSADGTMLVVNMKTINSPEHLRMICRSKKFASFLRQLHLYGFRKETRCLPNKRSSVKMAFYQHRYFQRDNSHLLYKINRVKAH